MLHHKVAEPVGHRDRFNIPGGLVVVAVRMEPSCTDQILVACAEREPLTALSQVD
jgi:hypothetical protein